MSKIEKPPEPLHCRAHYVTRLEVLREELASLDKRDLSIANWRLGVFIGGAIGLGLLLLGQVWGSVVAALGGTGFLFLIVWHGRVLEALVAVRICIKHYEDGLSRLDSLWHGQGPTGEEYIPDGHLYVQDLDVFGEGSLYQLVCRAESSVGRETMAAWFCSPAKVDEIARRQQGCRELRNAVDLREATAACGASLGRRVGTGSLFGWAEKGVMEGGWFLRSGLVGMSLLTLGSGVGLLLSLISPIWLLNCLMLQYAIGRKYRDRIDEVLGSVIEAHQELLVVVSLMELFERHPAEEGGELERFVGGLRSESRTASEVIRNLTRRIDLADAMHNQLFAPVGFVLFWSLHSALSLEAWRKRHGRAVRGWLEVLGELEALSSLACHSFENPDHVFPIVSEEGKNLIIEGVGHPLLDPTLAIRNDIALGAGHDLIMISGSNMSGKSTMLRTVGTNLVLAQAGGSVRARRMETSVFQIGGTLSIHDSLQLGASRFYAEILRIGALVKVTEGGGNLLFLLDEILHGTNSHDRRIGATALLKALVERGALGLVSTHDLALTEEIGLLPTARNVHFSDHLEGDRLIFDYRLAEGVVSRSNAIELMRSVGLPV